MELLALLPARVAPALAAALLHSLWQDTLLALATALTLAAMARAGAALRHTVAMGALMAMVLVPASTFVRVLHGDAPSIEGGWLAVTPLSLAASSGPFAPRQDALSPALALGWGLGAGLMLLRRFGGWRVVAALDRQPWQALPPGMQARVQALAAAMGIGREVAVRVSADVLGPFTARLLRPVIWLPLSLLTQLPREQLEALLAHELAHIARMDWLWNGVQCVLEALLFFHPAAWWLGRRIRIEREHACDDRAVAVCGDAIALAEALEQLERRRFFAPQLVLAAQGGSLMNRITRLLSAPRPRARWGAALGTGVLVLSGVLLATQVSFANKGRHAIHLSSTTDGPLRPGDSREVSAYGPDGWRRYSVRMARDGTLDETLHVDGARKPVTADTRRWVAQVLRGAVPPAPPAPPPLPPLPPGVLEPALAPPPPDAHTRAATPRVPAVAAPAAPPVPPVQAPAVPPPPPLPPPPPEIADTAMFRTLLQRVAADARVRAELGSPVALASNRVDGTFRVDEGARTDGEAALAFTLRGPKGRARVQVEAELDAGDWTLQRVDVAAQ